MNKQTEQKVRELIKLKGITDPSHPEIENIADQFPGEYTYEDEYVQFVMDIAKIVIRMDN